MKKTVCLILLSIYFGNLFYACNSIDDNNHLPIPAIKCGTAKISGKFRGFNDLRKHKESQNIYTVIFNPLTGRKNQIKVEIKNDETFSLEIPIETSSALGYIQLFSNNFYAFPLISGQESVFDLYFKGKELQIERMAGPDFLFGNTDLWYDVLFEALDAGPLSLNAWGHYDLDTLKYFMANPKEYIPFSLKYDLGNGLDILKKDKRIPEKALDKFEYEVKLMRIPQFIHFSGDIWNMYTTFYRIENNITEIDLKGELDSATYIPPNPDISYWIFLKEFDLNNPKYLYTEKFSYIIQMLLTNETLSIPPIEEQSLDDWMKQTKSILTDLVGFNEGMFYDALVCNAYSKQFLDRIQPLSDKQIQNIKNYYKGGEVEKILLRENERIIKLDKKRHSTIANITPVSEKNQLMSTIISKYKGKGVVVDFWATWCGPCLEAIAELHEMKTSFINKDVVFVYITSESSPKKVWEEKIKGIGGEHYYLSQEEWEYILNSFGFNAIPTYQYYDKRGQLKEQVTGFLRTDIFQNKIEKLLLE